MKSANPLFIPRNHRVEAVIAAAIDRQDYAPFEELLTVLSRPSRTAPNSPPTPIRRPPSSGSTGRIAGRERARSSAPNAH